MENTDKNEPTKQPEPHDLLSLIRAYNRREISLEEWLRRSREWAEAIMRRHDDDEPKQRSS